MTSKTKSPRTGQRHDYQVNFKVGELSPTEEKRDAREREEHAQATVAADLAFQARLAKVHGGRVA